MERVRGPRKEAARPSFYIREDEKGGISLREKGAKVSTHMGEGEKAVFHHRKKFHKTPRPGEPRGGALRTTRAEIE